MRQLYTVKTEYCRWCVLTRQNSRVNKEEIRRHAGVDIDITDTIESKHISWFGHLQNAYHIRWPKKLLKMDILERKSNLNLNFTLSNRSQHSYLWRLPTPKLYPFSVPLQILWKFNHLLAFTSFGLPPALRCHMTTCLLASYAHGQVNYLLLIPSSIVFLSPISFCILSLQTLFLPDFPADLIQKSISLVNKVFVHSVSHKVLVSHKIFVYHVRSQYSALPNFTTLLNTV